MTRWVITHYGLFMSTTADLLREIDEYLAHTGMAQTTFGRLAVNDGKFVGRLRTGKRAWPETHERVRQFIQDHRQGAPAPKRPEAA